MNKNYSYFIYFLLLSFFLMNFSLSKIISNNIEINQVCSQATYDNTSIKEEEESIIHVKDNNLDTNDLIDGDEFNF